VASKESVFVVLGTMFEAKEGHVFKAKRAPSSLRKRFCSWVFCSFVRFFVFPLLGEFPE
jgi:hypothetical protein